MMDRNGKRARAAMSVHNGDSKTSRLPRSPSVSRITLTKPEAAAALGISIDSFERHVQPELRVIRRGRMRLIPCSELQRWADENAAFVFTGQDP
jgi:hypothetical protein